MARTPRSAAEKLAMRKKKSRALLLFNIIAFSAVSYTHLTLPTKLEV